MGGALGAVRLTWRSIHQSPMINGMVDRSDQPAIESDERLDALFHALSDRTRRAILLAVCEGERTINEIAEPFEMSLAAVSKHIMVLERAGLLAKQRDGKFQRCRFRDAPLVTIDALVHHYRSFWNNRLAEMANFVESDDSRRVPGDTQANREAVR